VADALDLIERRLFGFKNVNQIHLNLAHFAPVYLLTFVLQLHGTRQSFIRRAADKRRERKRVERRREMGESRTGSSFYSLYFK